MARRFASVPFGTIASAAMLISSPQAVAGRSQPRQPACVSSPWLAIDLEKDRHVRVPVTVNGVHTVGVLDSGASRTVIDSRFARQLGLDTRPGFRADGVTDSVSGDMTEAVNIATAGIDLPPIDAGVMDLSEISRVVRKPVDVIIGQELFERNTIDLDLPNGRVRIVPSPCRPDDIAGVALPLIRLDRSYAVKLSVEGRPPVPFMFDVGSNVALYVSGDYARKNRLLEQRPTSKVASIGAGGVDIAEAVTLHDVELADTFLTGIPALIPPTWNQPAVGVLGLPVLSRFRAQISFADRMVRLAADRDAVERPFSKDRSGLNAIAHGDHLQVLHVATGSPAEQAGLSAGDQIVSINGEDVTSSISRTKGPISHQPEGTPLDLTRRDGKVFRLVLENYF